MLLLSCTRYDDPWLEGKIMASGEGFRAGIAVMDISPPHPEKIELEGYEEPRRADGIHDPLTARTLVLVTNDEIALLISLDLIGLIKLHTDPLEEMISFYTGISPDHIFIHCTHTHSGPPTMSSPAGILSYREMLCRKITVSALAALENTRSVSAVAFSGYSDVAVINRRHPDRRVENPFSVIEFRDKEHQLIASLLNFACHPVVLGQNNTQVSADFIYYLRKTYEELQGGKAIYFNGALGDRNPPPIYPDWPYGRDGGTFSMAEEFGSQLALDMIQQRTQTDSLYGKLNVETGSVRLNEGLLTHWDTKIGIIDMGAAQLAILGGEPLESLGDNIKSMLPGPHRLLIGMTGGYIGYLVPEEEWGACSYSFLQSSCYEETRIRFENPVEQIENRFLDLRNLMFP